MMIVMIDTSDTLPSKFLLILPSGQGIPSKPWVWLSACTSYDLDFKTISLEVVGEKLEGQEFSKRAESQGRAGE